MALARIRKAGWNRSLRGALPRDRLWRNATCRDHQNQKLPHRTSPIFLVPYPSFRSSIPCQKMGVQLTIRVRHRMTCLSFRPQAHSRCYRNGTRAYKGPELYRRAHLELEKLALSVGASGMNFPSAVAGALALSSLAPGSCGLLGLRSSGCDRCAYWIPVLSTAASYGVVTVISGSAVGGTPTGSRGGGMSPGVVGGTPTGSG